MVQSLLNACKDDKLADVFNILLYSNNLNEMLSLQDKDGNNALMWACLNNNTKIVALL